MATQPVTPEGVAGTFLKNEEWQKTLNEAIQREDIVCLLWGMRSPIILRPRADEAGGGFTFVGDAYVDGIMYGEFLETTPAHVDFKIY